MRSSLHRTCAAFVVGIARQNIRALSTVPLLQHGSRSTLALPSKSSSSSALRLASTFQAPEPPKSNGHAVYNDIEISTTEAEGVARNSDADAVFVVSGASRGIGLQFVKTLLARCKGTIVALCRKPEKAQGLNDFMMTLSADQQSRIKVLPLDLEDQDSIDSAVENIKSSFDRVDMLLNVAGLLGDGKDTPGPERSITKIERDWITKTMDINMIGPVMLSQGLAPLMEQRRRRGKSDDSGGRPIAVVANLSARVGSISDNGLGGWYSYRISKSALNQATRTMAHELKRKSIWCVALHPGTTDTDLSKPFQKNVQGGRLFPVDFTVESLLGVIDSMKEDNSGGLYDWAGKAIPF
ncbi:MAG: hypothetical protein SGBAC_013352 [Bacillariaceae sp.]